MEDGAVRVDMARETGKSGPLCVRCGEPMPPLAPVPVPALGSVELRRCGRCGSRGTQEQPPRFVFTCEGCILPFLDESVPPEGSRRCAACSGGQSPAGLPEPEVTVATEAEIHAALDGSWSFVTSDTLATYLDHVVRELCAKIKPPVRRCRVVLVDEPILRTLALPSGKILMSLGMLRFLGDEAELAFVLGHELAHASSKEVATRLVRSGFGALSRDQEGKPQTAWTEAVLDMVRLGYGEKLETEADRQALEKMLVLRYDPASALRFLDRLQDRMNEGEQEVAELVMAHPPPAYRIRKLEKALYGRVAREAVPRVNREVFRRAAAATVSAGQLRKTHLSRELPVQRSWGRVFLRVAATVLGMLTLGGLLLALGIFLRS